MHWHNREKLPENLKINTVHPLVKSSRLNLCPLCGYPLNNSKICRPCQNHFYPRPE